jgi:membrane protease YdiL (CAAX protease family)
MIRCHPLATYFAFAYGISWLLWAPLWLPAFGVDGLPVLPFHHALGALGPITAAFLVSAMETGWAGPLDLFRRMGLWRGRLAWMAVALLVPFALLALAAVGASLIGGESLSLAGFGSSREFPQFSALGFLAYNIVSFGYGEEVGWRGFALPRLQTRHSAFVATFLLTLGWALWHLPLFFYRPGYMGMGATDIVGWFMSFLTGAVLLTWLYNESRGSLLVVALFHAAVDIVFTSDVSSQSVTNAAGVLITFWGIIVLVAAGPAYLSRRGKIIRLEQGAVVTGFVHRDGYIAQTDR